MALAKKFLRAVWSKQPHWDGPRAGRAILSVKNWETDEWVEHPQPVSGVEVPTLRDLYFAPNLYTGKLRRKVHCLPGRWLYADLDEVDPEGLDLRPTVAWRTSPGRYQAMWLLKRPLAPAQLGRLNQKLTYAVKADRGGWSLTKVLRVPGSVSTKHGAEHVVKLLWADGPVYEGGVLWDQLREVTTPSDEVGTLPILHVAEGTPRSLLKKYEIPVRIQKMARAEDTDGQDRSATIWKLERDLLEAGMPPEAVFVVVKASVWNKFKGQGREDKQIWTEIQRAVKTSPTKRSSKSKRKSASNGSDSRRRRSMTLEQFMGREIRKPTWMVEGIWSESAHGVLAGPPKTYKSVLSTDLAVSVASGTKFLNHFPVPQTGPVILIQKENDEGEVHDRFARILHSRGLMGSASVTSGSLTYTRDNLPPVHIFDPDFDLTDPADIRYLRRECRKKAPVLVVLDPLYLLVPSVDENSAHEMTPVLERLLRIKQNYNAGTLLIHHFKKQQAEGGTRSMAERISGTGVFGRWYESALLLERPDEGTNEIQMTPVHRGHPASGIIWADFDLGSEFDMHYSVAVESKKEQAKREYDELKLVLEENDGRATFKMIEDATGMKRQAVIRKVEAAGYEIQKRRKDGRVQQLVVDVHTNGNGRHPHRIL